MNTSVVMTGDRGAAPPPTVVMSTTWLVLLAVRSGDVIGDVATHHPALCVIEGGDDPGCDGVMVRIVSLGGPIGLGYGSAPLVGEDDGIAWAALREQALVGRVVPARVQDAADLPPALLLTLPRIKAPLAHWARHGAALLRARRHAGGSWPGGGAEQAEHGDVDNHGWQGEPPHDDDVSQGPDSGPEPEGCSGPALPVLRGVPPAEGAEALRKTTSPGGCDAATPPAAVLSTSWLVALALRHGDVVRDVADHHPATCVVEGHAGPDAVRIVPAGEMLALGRGAFPLLFEGDQVARAVLRDRAVVGRLVHDDEGSGEAVPALAIPSPGPRSSLRDWAVWAAALLHARDQEHEPWSGAPLGGSDGGPASDREPPPLPWLLSDAPDDGSPSAQPVLLSAPPTEGADAADLAGLRRLAALARPWPRRLAPEPEVAARALAGKFAWMPEAVAVVRRELALVPPGGAAVLAPLLIVGPPGAGKSSFARAVLDGLGVPYRLVGVADGGGATGLAGAGRGWRSARPCLPLEVMLGAGVATIGIIVDDADRQPADGEHGSVAAWLLSVLEPTNAARYWDPFAMTEADLRTVTWILCANDPAPLPRALRDRCVELRVEPPPPEMLPNVIRRMIGDVLRVAGWSDAWSAGSSSGYGPPELSDDVVEALAAAAARGGEPASLRPLRRAVRAALAAQRLGEDPLLAGVEELWRHGGSDGPYQQAGRVGYRGR